MNEKHISYRCPRCGKVLAKSDNPEYTYQCFDCDEDFYSIEAAEFVTTFTEPTEEDRREYSEFNINMDDWIKVICSCRDVQGYVFLPKKEFEMLGVEYIKDHAVLIRRLNTYFVEIPQNDYHNDLTRNPEKIIPVEFVEIECGTGREVYRGTESENYYLREVSRREDFAKWLICGTRRRTDDGNPPRANVIFQNGDQTEKVTYNDWNGVCAYSNTFNRNFRPKTTENT